MILTEHDSSGEIHRKEGAGDGRISCNKHQDDSWKLSEKIETKNKQDAAEHRDIFR